MQTYMYMVCVPCRRELDELEELQKRERDCLEMVKEYAVNVYQAHRLHHLISTKQVGLGTLLHIFDIDRHRTILNVDSF